MYLAGHEERYLSSESNLVQWSGLCSLLPGNNAAAVKMNKTQITVPRLHNVQSVTVRFSNLFYLPYNNI